MSMVVAHNMSAINTKRQFATSARGMSSAMEKLSSGYKINAGKDDPSGLVISEKLRSQINGLQRAQQNTEEAINVMGIAEGALNEMNNILKKMKALAIHSSNTGVTSPDQIAADQAEMDSSIQTLDRIAKTTNFSGDKLLNGAKDIVFDQDTLTKGTQQNSLLDANASTFSQIFKRDAFNVSINYTGSTDASSRTGTGTVDFSQQAMKAYFEVDTASDPENRAQVKNGVFTQGQSFTLTGNKGTRAFTFKQGDSVADMVNQIKSAADTTGIDAALVFNSEQEIAKLQNGGGGETAVLSTYNVGLKDKDGEDINLEIVGKPSDKFVDDIGLSVGVNVDENGDITGYTLTMHDEFNGDVTADWNGTSNVDLGTLFKNDALKGLKLQALKGDVDVTQSFPDAFDADLPSVERDDYLGANTGTLTLSASTGLDSETATTLKSKGIESVEVAMSGNAGAPVYNVSLRDKDGTEIETLRFTQNDLVDAGVTVDANGNFSVADLGQALGNDSFNGIALEVDGATQLGRGTIAEGTSISSDLKYSLSEDGALSHGPINLKRSQFVEGDSSAEKLPEHVTFEFNGLEELTAARFTNRDLKAYDALRKALGSDDLSFTIELGDTATAENPNYKLTAVFGENSLVISEDWDGESDINLENIVAPAASANQKTKDVYDALTNMGNMEFAGKVTEADFGGTDISSIVDNNGAVTLTNSLYGKNSGRVSIKLDDNALEDLYTRLSASGSAADKTKLDALKKALSDGGLTIDYEVTGAGANDPTHSTYGLDLKLMAGDVEIDSLSLTHADLGLLAGTGGNGAGQTLTAANSVFNGATLRVTDDLGKYDNGAPGTFATTSGSGEYGAGVSVTVTRRGAAIESNAAVDITTDSGGQYTSSSMNNVQGPGGIGHTFSDFQTTAGEDLTITSSTDTDAMRAKIANLFRDKLGLTEAQIAAMEFEMEVTAGGTAAAPTVDVTWKITYDKGAGPLEMEFLMKSGWDGTQANFDSANVQIVTNYDPSTDSVTQNVATEVSELLKNMHFETNGDIDVAAIAAAPVFTAGTGPLTVDFGGIFAAAGTPNTFDKGSLSMTFTQAAMNDIIQNIATSITDDAERAKFFEDFASGNIGFVASVNALGGSPSPTLDKENFSINIAIYSKEASGDYDGKMPYANLTANFATRTTGNIGDAMTLSLDGGTTPIDAGATVAITGATWADMDVINYRPAAIDGATAIGAAGITATRAINTVQADTLTGREGINGYDSTIAGDVRTITTDFDFDNGAGNNDVVTFTAKNATAEIGYDLQQAMAALAARLGTTVDLTFELTPTGSDDDPKYGISAKITDGNNNEYVINFNGEWDGGDSFDFSPDSNGDLFTIDGTYHTQTQNALTGVGNALAALGGFDVTANINAGGTDLADLNHAANATIETEIAMGAGNTTAVLSSDFYGPDGGELSVNITQEGWENIYAMLDPAQQQAFVDAAKGLGGEKLTIEYEIIPGAGGGTDHTDFGLRLRITNGLDGGDRQVIGSLDIPAANLNARDGEISTTANGTFTSGERGAGGTTTTGAIAGLTVNVKGQGAYRTGDNDGIADNQTSGSKKYDKSTANYELLEPDNDFDSDSSTIPTGPAKDDGLPDANHLGSEAIEVAGKNVTGGVGTASDPVSVAREKGDLVVFNNTTAKGTGEVTQGVSGVQLSDLGKESILFGGNTDGQGRIFVKFLDDNKFELFKDSSMSAESKVGSGISGQEITEYNNSGLTGLTLDLAGTELAGKKGVYISFAGIEGQSGIRYDGDVVNTAKNVVDKDGKAVLDADGNPVTTFDGAARFDADRTLVTGVELGTNTSSDGVIYMQNKYTIDDKGNATIQVSAYKNKNMRAEDLVAQSQVYQVGKFMLDEDGKLAKDENGNLIPDESFEATSLTVVLNEKRNADDTKGTGLGIVLSIDTAAFKGQQESTTLEGNMTFTNLGARIYSQEYGSDAFVKITQSKGAIFNYYDRAGDASSKRLVDAGDKGTTYQMNGQDATLSVNGTAVSTSGLRLKMASQDIQADFTFNQGKVGSTTLAQVGYDIGSIFTRIGALNYGSAEADEEGMSGLLCNAGHVTQERIGNFQGGMQLQLGEGPGDQDRTVVAMKSLTSDNLGKVTRSGAWDVGSSVITERTFSMQDVAGGGMAELKSDPILAMAIIEQAISDVTEMRATIGAFQTNLLQTNSNNLSVTIENITKTESGIRDADMADEMAEFTKQQVLQSAAMSMMGQANQASQNVLQLLR